MFSFLSRWGAKRRGTLGASEGIAPETNATTEADTGHIFVPPSPFASSSVGEAASEPQPSEPEAEPEPGDGGSTAT